MVSTNTHGTLRRAYFYLFNWFAAPGQQLHPIREFKLHLLFSTFFISQIVMLTFTILGPRYIAGNLVLWGPKLCIVLAWISLLVYRYRRNILLSTTLLLTANTAYVFMFCWVINGFRQTAFAWFSLLPIIAGMLTNRLWATVWCIIVIALSLYGQWATHIGLVVNLVQEGHVLLIVLQQFLFLVCAGILTHFLLLQQDISSSYLREKTVSKQNLLRILVHDISTPLTIMRLTGQMLTQGQQTDAAAAGLKIDRNAERISNIIHLIRDLESWEAHHVRVPTTPIDLVSILDQVVELYQNRLATKHIQVAKFYASEVYVMGHETMLIHQIFGNLLSNAIKFSHEGGRIDLAVEPLSAHSVKVVIRDYGIGMPKRTRDDLFDPLATTKRMGTAGEVGTGFGLPITKNCVEMIGGHIEVKSLTKEESLENYGTSMMVILRRAIENN